MNKILSCAYFVIIAAAAIAADERPPLMGWSSWNTYRVNINEQLILKQARLLVELGLKDCGYNHVNIDDGFFGGRDPAGRLKTHPERFPNGLKGIVDGIHSLGLKAGIYSDGGANTCGSFWDKDKFGIGVGFYLHDEEDADYYFREHDFDFIKVDFCGGDPRQNFDKLALDERQRYTAIRRAIDAAKPGVRMNICRWDFPGTWAAELADGWRISHDIRPRWSSVKDIIRQNLYLGAYASRGHYNDMDMLEVGRGMTDVEDHTHFATWCFMSSPLLIGCDLEKVKADARLRELLADKELIALNQDVAEPQGNVVRRDGEAYVLARDIGEAFGTTRAVLFLNLGDETKELSVTTKELELDPADAKGDAISVSLPPHGATVRRVSGRHRREKRRYEAETAYLPLYQELCDAAEAKTAYYRESKEASGGVVVSGAGGRGGNDIVFRRVWSENGGEYELSIAALGDGAKPAISVNGVHSEVSRVRLNPGVNEIRLSNSGAVLPEIDYIEVVPPGTTASLRLPGCEVMELSEGEFIKTVPSRKASTPKCIVTYTFDDGLLDQYELAYPMFREAGLKATFFIIGSKIGNPDGMRSKAESHTPTMTWAQVREMAECGMEIASHGWAHGKYSKMYRTAILDDIRKNQIAIKENAGVECRSFAAPYNAKTGGDGFAVREIAREAGLPFFRMHQKAAGGKMTAERMNEMVENAKKNGEWLVFMIHGIARGYDAWENPDELRKHLQWIKEQNDVRVATFAEAASFAASEAQRAGHIPGESRFVKGASAADPVQKCESDVTSRVIRNDSWWNTVDGKPIYSNGGGCYFYEGRWYWYGCRYEEAERVRFDSAFQVDVGGLHTTFVGVTCYSSDDLVNWRDEGIVYAGEEAESEAHGRWFGRVGVAAVPSEGKFVLAMQYMGGVLLAVADSPRGPFVFQEGVDMSASTGYRTTGDQSVFYDDIHGKGYLVYSKPHGRDKTYVADLGYRNGRAFVGAPRLVFAGHGREGNCMFMHRGKYYLCASDLYGWDGSRAYWMVADSPMGPYRKSSDGDMFLMRNAVEDYCHVSQTGFFVTVRGAEQETVVFCGDRWTQFADNGIGFNVWTPLSFDGDEPVFNSLSEWTLDAATGKWAVASGSNYVRNGSFDADRRQIPIRGKPNQDFVSGWTVEPVGGFLNATNKTCDKAFVTGKFALSLSAPFPRRAYQKIEDIPNGNYMLRYWRDDGKGWQRYEKSVCVTNGTHMVEFTATAPCRIDDVSLVATREGAVPCGAFWYNVGR